MPDERDLRAPIMRLVDVLRRNFTPPEYIPGCLVKDITDKDEYTTDNGWIEAVCGHHNQQRVRYMGKPADPVADSTYIDVIHYPDTKTFKVDWMGGTAAVGGLDASKVSKVWESDGGTIALQADANGNVGVGTITPASRLDAVVSSADAIPTDATLHVPASSVLGVYNASDSSTYTGVLMNTRLTSSSRVLIGLEHKNDYQGDVFFRGRDGSTTSSELMRLTYDAKLGIANDTPLKALHVGAGTASPVTVGDGIYTAISGTASNIVRDTSNSVEGFIQANNGGVDIGSATNNALTLQTNATDRMNIDTNGTVYVNDNANANMTVGLTINQSGNDDEILALKSSDITHGVTNLVETDTYGDILKANADSGGVTFRGFSENITGFNLQGIVTNEVTSTTTASTGAFILQGRLKSGAGVTDMAGTANVVVMRNNTTTRWILRGDGDIHYGGTDDGSISDAYDDAELLAGYRALVSPEWSDAAKRFKGFLSDTENILVQQGVLTAPLADGGLVSDSALKGLLIDAIYQLAGRVEQLEKQLGEQNGI